MQVEQRENRNTLLVSLKAATHHRRRCRSQAQTVSTVAHHRLQNPY